MENESNLYIKGKILEKTQQTKNTYSNNLETIEKQNELIEQNYNKIIDINDQLKESSSIIRKIKRSICDCFKSKPREKKDNMNKIIITNNTNSQIKEKKNIENDNFENKLLNELDDIHNLSKIQNQQITNQNKILNKMDNNVYIVNYKIKKNHNEIKNI